MTGGRHDGPPRRILPPAVFLIALVASVVGHIVWPLATVVSWPWRWIGIVPLGLGVALNLVADRDFKQHGTTVKPYEDASALLTTGVFARTRHPMYLGMVLILGGTALLLGSLWPWLVTAVLAAVLQWVYVGPEEAQLARLFGERWQAYRRQVRRWI